MRSLAIASTGMLAQQTNVEVISNNIANLSTTAFKRRRAEKKAAKLALQQSNDTLS